MTAESRPKKSRKKPTSPKSLFKFLTLGLASIAAFVASVEGFRSNAASLFGSLLSLAKPNIELVWLDGTQHPPRLDQPILLDPANVDADTRRLRVPLQVAIRNKENRPLRVASLEVSVGDSVQLRTATPLRLQPGRVVHEHAGTLLQPSPTYFPLADQDTLILPITTALVGWLGLTEKRMPLLVPWVAALRESSLLDSTTIPVDITVFFEGRAKYCQRTRFAIAPLLDPTWPRGRAIMKPAKDDRRTFKALAEKKGQDRANWNAPYPRTGDSIDYRRNLLAGAGYQSFFVNHVLRYVIADSNSDGMIDYELMDFDGDGRPDYRAISRGFSRRVILCGPEIVRVAKHINRDMLLYMAQRINSQRN